MNTLRNNPSVPDDDQSKFIQDRISNTEKHVGEVCSTLGHYTRNAARLRDKTDDVASVLSQYAESENVNVTLQAALHGFAASYSSIADHRDAFVRRLEAHVVGSFAPVGVQCKEVREEVKLAFVARDRELARRKQLDKLKQRNPKNRPKIIQAETELARASADVSRTLRSLEDHMDTFESHKLSTTTTALRSLVRAELALHVREVELLTQAYVELSSVDLEQDLEGFRSAVRSPQREGHVRTSLRHSIANLFTSSAGRNIKTNTSPAVTRPRSATLSRKNMKDPGNLQFAESLSSSESSSVSDEEPVVLHRRSASAPKLTSSCK